MNDTDRENWVRNDEGLYAWWCGTRLPVRRFVRENRQEIDAAIEKMTSGTKSQHYLLYG